MAKQTINLGSGDSRGDGESIRTAFDKCNDNFSENYASIASIEADIATLDGSKIVYGDLSVTTASASGAGSLSYNSSTGVFTFTPAASVAETNDLSASVTWTNIPDAYVPQSAVTQHQAAIRITESQITDLSHTNEVNDLTASVTWANVPDANITESSVTQHQGALTITESQISDLGNYITSYTVTESDVTQHQAALTITESQISDLSHTSTGNFTFSNNGITTANAASNITIAINGATAGDPPAFVSKQWSFDTDGSFNFHNPLDLPSLQASITATKVGQWDDAYGWGDHSSAGYLTSYTVTESDVTTHQAALTITESQVSDLGTYVESDTTGITGADQVTNIVTLTQAEYDDIGTPNASTVYIIVG